MTLSDERLKLLDKVQKLRADKQRYTSAVLFDGRELNVMAEALLDRAIEDERELLSLRASPHGEAGAAEDWRDDPASDERWNAGVNYAIERLCDIFGIEPASINWDAATETLDGDVMSVLCNVLTAAYGDEWASNKEITTRIRSALLPTPSVETGERPSITEALRMMNCPRPCNHRPDEFTVGECVDAGECGCVAGNGLSASPATVEPVEVTVRRMRDEEWPDRQAASPGSSAGAATDDQRLAAAAAIRALFERCRARGTTPGAFAIVSAVIDALASAPPQREGLEEADGWFKLGGDARLGACATEGCGGQPTWRLERDGIGSNYCSGCKAKIEALTGKGGE